VSIEYIFYLDYCISIIFFLLVSLTILSILIIGFGERFIKIILFIISGILYYIIRLNLDNLYITTNFILDLMDNTNCLNISLLNTIFQFEIILPIIKQISDFLIFIDIIVLIYEIIR